MKVSIYGPRADELMSAADEDRLLQEADQLARQIVVNVTGIDDLIDKWLKHGYRPTIDCAEGQRYQRLADLYDWRAKERGISVTAFRLTR